MGCQLLKTTDELGVSVASPRDSAGDEELVAAAKGGDDLAFETIVKRHLQRIFGLALRYTRSREDAEDIVQQTFQKAFIHLSAFEGRSSFPTWLVFLFAHPLDFTAERNTLDLSHCEGRSIMPKVGSNLIDGL